MKLLLTLFLVGLALGSSVTSNADPVATTNSPGSTIEKIICLRHGEKPTNDLGQLTCRGLNRALALPEVLTNKYGMPDYIFAPLTVQKGMKSGYNYVRPLMTIEPTAIRCGLPVNTQFAFTDIAGLETELLKTNYENATVFVAWEHTALRDFVAQIVKDNDGNINDVPQEWPKGKNEAYDAIFVVTMTRSAGHTTAVFSKSYEGLNGLSDDCPGISGKK